MAGAETRQGSRKQLKHKDKPHTSANHNNTNNNGTERLKTVVRRLPPNLPEDVFWQSVQAWVTEETVTWKMYHPGKLRKRSVMHKESVPSRAYIAFKNEEMLATFSREYDGHIFKDKAGNESQAIVEFAPFQKVPTEKKKADARNNTIDKDEDYISFLEYLKVLEKAEPPSLEALIAAAQSAPQPTTTPLLEALKAEKSAQKDKEAIIRNHAHYKESAIIAKKEEAAKKKASTVAQAQAQAAASIAAQKQNQIIEVGPISQPASRKAKKAAAAAAAAQKAAAQDAQPAVRIQMAAPKQPASAGGVSVPPSVPQHSIAPTPTPPTAPHAHRERGHRGHKVSGGPAVHAKHTDSTAAAAPAPAPAPAPTEGGATASATGVLSPPAPGTPQTRRGRPVIGIGRHFEAALSGAVGSGGGSGGERKRRGEKDRDREGGAAATPSGPAGGGGSAPEGKSAGGKHKDHHTLGGKHSKSTGTQPAIPNILQRNDAQTVPGEVSIAQRPQSPRDAQSGHQADAPPARGSGGRRGRGRGRGGPRGG